MNTEKFEIVAKTFQGLEDVLAEELKNEGFVCEGYAANVLEAEQVKAVHARILEDLGKCD